ncbi:MAG: 1-phosphofructokinase family hexose kinase [Clostridia bacterium]|nr:1-phosphofructokinase family hexose kinase [Clostridia bacterium]
MIYTLTINPAIDMNVTAEDLVLGKVNRTKNAAYSANGKGLNVSVALRYFGVESGIIGIFGGFSGEYILDVCKENGYKICGVEIDGITRINVFVEVNGSEYKLVNNGPLVDVVKQKELLDVINELEDMDVLVISGSLANGIEETYYEQMLNLCKLKKTKVILDISSPKLKELLNYKPLLIKPNDEEIKEIFGYDIVCEKDVIRVLRQLYEMGACNVLITLGEKGSYFYNGNDVYFCEAYPVKLKSSACAGDAYLGAFLSQWLPEQKNVETALTLASATGANVAESNGLGDFLRVAEYQEKITVRKII